MCEIKTPNCNPSFQVRVCHCINVGAKPIKSFLVFKSTYTLDVRIVDFRSADLDREK